MTLIKPIALQSTSKRRCQWQHAVTAGCHVDFQICETNCRHRPHLCCEVKGVRVDACEELQESHETLMRGQLSSDVMLLRLRLDNIEG